MMTGLYRVRCPEDLQVLRKSVSRRTIVWPDIRICIYYISYKTKLFTRPRENMVVKDFHFSSGSNLSSSELVSFSLRAFLEQWKLWIRPRPLFLHGLAHWGGITHIIGEGGSQLS
jgi:hypothetical protein